MEMVEQLPISEMLVTAILAIPTKGAATLVIPIHISVLVILVTPIQIREIVILTVSIRMIGAIHFIQTYSIALKAHTMVIRQIRGIVLYLSIFRKTLATMLHKFLISHKAIIQPYKKHRIHMHARHRPDRQQLHRLLPKVRPPFHLPRPLKQPTLLVK